MIVLFTVMKKIKKFLILIFAILIILLVFVYCFFLKVVPNILNTNKSVKEIERIVENRTGAKFEISDFKVISNYKLVYKITAKKIHMSDFAKEDLLDVHNLEVDFWLPFIQLTELNIDRIFINETGLKNIIKKTGNKKTSQYKLKRLPAINIKSAEIWADNNEINKVFINVKNIKFVNENDDKTYCYFNAEIVSSLLKNTINIGDEGYFLLDKNSLYAKNLQIQIGINSLFLNGKITDDNKKSDFLLFGKDLPVNDIESSLLYFLKLKKPGKQFLENFKNFDGLIDVDLTFKNEGIFGTCIAKKLSAQTVFFDVPVMFKRAVFNFNDREISLKEEGTFGNEKVFTSFKMEKLLTSEQEVKGEVNSILTDKFADKYIPNLTIKNSVNAYVFYKIKNKKIDVEYIADLKPKSDIKFKNAFLGLENLDRKLYVTTHKDGDSLTVKSYNYSIKEDKLSYKKIILGDGLFEKRNGHLQLKYLTFKTNGFAPFSAIGAISKYLKGGYFNGNLKYDYIDNKVTGNFKLINANYKNFFVKEAKVNAKTDNLYINGQGTYNNSPFSCYIEIVNSFDNQLIINNMDLFLAKYIISTKKTSAPPNITNINLPDAAKDIDITVKKWNIKVNKIQRKKILLENILLSGSLSKNIFKFKMIEAHFAKGILRAEGLYNFNDNSSKIDFSAQNIDSNIVADSVFNLPEQIHGIASGSIHAETKNKFQNIKAHINFDMKDGYLLQLGSTEFMLKKSRKLKRPLKIRLKDIINIDITRTKSLSSDIKGAFDMENYLVKNIHLTSQQKYLSLLIEGEYNIEEQDADLKLWGKYNKNAQKGVRILFIPLSWIVNIIFRPEKTLNLYIDKIKQVPDIVAQKKEEKYFRVKLRGNLNDNNVKVELKTIK